MKAKTFNWENYTKGRTDYKFEDLTHEELEDWAYNCNFKIIKTKKGIFVKGKFGHKIKWK